MVSKDVCPCCGKKLRSVVAVSPEAELELKVFFDTLVPDKDGFVLVPVGLLKYADDCCSSVEK